MKIRNGFVSNSSSSSFLAVGHPVHISKIDLDSDKVYLAFGKYLSEGYDMFEITKEHLDILPYLDYAFVFMDVEKQIWEADSFTQFDVSGEGSFVLWSGDVDMHSSQDNLAENYELDIEKAKQEFKDGKIDVDTLMEMIK